MLRRLSLIPIDLIVRARRLSSRRPKRARVLLATRNSLMAASLLRNWECIRDVVDAEASMTTFDGDAAVRPRAAQAGVRWAKAMWSRFEPWDLIVMADHMNLDYPPSVPKLLIGHGVASSRLVRGGTYRYDRERTLDRKGRPVYRMMLDAAETTAREALRQVPEYAGRIRVVGSLDTDDLLRLRASALEARAEIGVGDRTLVVVMSSWGPHALVPRYGRDLLPELRRLAATGDYAFVLTMHHNLWSSPGAEWSELVRSGVATHVHVVEPEEDAGRFVAAADVFVTDNTSYAAKAAALGRPIIPVHVPPESLVQGSFAWWLIQHHRPVEIMSDLAGALLRSETYRLRGAPEVVSHVGKSERFVRDAFLELLPHRASMRGPAPLSGPGQPRR